MLQALRRRLERDEEGFTLIELMVVVLIIAILLAIAIPTFLGARTRAQDRAAQSNIRNALTAEKTFYTDQQAYGDPAVATNLTALQGIEPAIGWTAGLAVATGKLGVTATAVNSLVAPTILDQLVLSAKSASGTCFYEMDESITGTIAPGTWYSASTNCTVPGAGPPIATPPTTKAVAAAGAGAWGISF